MKNGDRLVFDDSGTCIATDQQDTYARAARFAIEAGPLVGKAVAWIGGGLCIGPRVFMVAQPTQTVYEVEPALREFCPPGAAFACGDWRDTLKAKYDVIVYDLGGEVPYAELSKFLREGGKILPEER
jgi:hypothetical protein